MIEREITNPHDKAYIDISDREAACMVVTLISDGWYGIQGDDGMPMLSPLGGEKAAEWWREQFGHSILEANISQRRLKAAMLSMRLDGERTSINDFVGRAHQLAHHMEDTDAQGSAADGHA